MKEPVRYVSDFVLYCFIESLSMWYIQVGWFRCVKFLVVGDLLCLQFVLFEVLYHFVSFNIYIFNIYIDNAFMLDVRYCFST